MASKMPFPPKAAKPAAKSSKPAGKKPMPFGAPMKSKFGGKAPAFKKGGKAC